MGIGRGFKRTALMASLVLGALVVSAAPAAATSRPTTFWLYMGMSCVGGTATDGATVHVVWKKADGTVKLNDVYMAGRNGGGWEACAPSARRVLKSGDKVKATVNGATRKLVIPLLKIKMDAATDTFYGRAPANSKIRLGWDSSGLEEIKVPVGPDGRWEYRHPTYDIQSGLHAYARWKSAAGHTVTFENIAP